jgi:hydroxymethylbilane synthase
MLAPIDHRDTDVAVTCERAFLAALDGSCRTPIAGYARIEAGELRFDGILLSQDGSESYDASFSGSPTDPAAVGREAGRSILARAPRAFLQSLGIG